MNIAELVSLITAVAALLAILEMRWQRQSSYRPDLVIGSTPFNVWQGTEGLVTSTSAEYDDTPPSYRMAAVRVVNIGFGAAKSVTVEWMVDFHTFVARIGQMNPAVAAAILVDEDFVGFEPDAGGITHFVRPQMRGRITSLSPGDQGVELKLPPVYLALYETWAETATTIGSDHGVLEIPDPVAITLKLAYRDLGENKHSKSFTLQPAVALMRGYGIIPGPSGIIVSGILEVAG